MSKKRPLMFLLALLPLGLGGAYAVISANEPQSVESLSLSNAVSSLEAPSHAEQGSAPVIGEPEENSVLALAADDSAPIGVGEPSEQAARVEVARTLVTHDAPASDSVLDRDVRLEPDMQVAALVDDGWHVQRRSFNAWGPASIGLAGGARRGSGGGGSAGGDPSPGDIPPQTNGGGSVTPPPQTDEHGQTSPPSSGPADGSNETDGSNATEGSSDESGGGVQPPQDQPPKQEGIKPPEEDVGGYDPIEETPVYFPPSETYPPVVQVPEPATLGLLGLGLLGCAAARRRKARR